MTTIRRRRVDARFQVVAVWDQEGARYMWCVLDRTINTWARGAKPEGYEQQAEAIGVAIRLREKA